VRNGTKRGREREMSRCFLLLAKASFLLHFVAVFSSNAVSASSRGPYTSITALDKFGNSVQLRNANLSSRHGSLVVAAKATSSGAIVVCSIDQRSPGLKRPARGAAQNPLVHIIGMDDDIAEDERGRIVALVCSGIKADAVLLRSLLREQSRRVWERYDSTLTVNRVSDSLAQVLLSFMGYDRSREVNDGSGPVIMDKDFRMSRPFGVDSLVLGIEGTLSGSSKKELDVHLSAVSIVNVDASGVQISCDAKAVGGGSPEADKLLKQRWRPGMSSSEVKQMCTEVIKEVLFDKDAENSEGNAFSDILYNVLDLNGVRCQTAKLNAS
jgi:20S proteasome alpha/beta subunit